MKYNLLFIFVALIGFNLCLVTGPFYNVFIAGIVYVVALMSIFAEIGIPIWDGEYK